MDEPVDEPVLHLWQTRLLMLLRAGESPAAIRAALLADPELRSLHAHAAELDLHALAVAVELVAKWGPAAEAGDGATTDDARATAPPRRR